MLPLNLGIFFGHSARVRFEGAINVPEHLNVQSCVLGIINGCWNRRNIASIRFNMFQQ